MNILLICSAGLSTSLLVTKMKEYARSIGEMPVILAQSVDDIDHLIDDYDIVMVGPQIRHKYDGLLRNFAHLGKPIVMIEAMDYGLCRGKEVYELAKTKLEIQKERESKL